MVGQSVRPSQFITNYGVGSLLETSDGPSVMMDFAKCGIFADPQSGMPGLVQDIANFEIVDKRLSASLLNGAHIFAIPTNEDLGIPTAREVYQTKAFPAWSICVAQHAGGDVIYRYRPTNPAQQTTGCPECGPMNRFDVWRKARREATTFVRACSDGHLDDVPWQVAVQHRAGCTSDEAYWWRGTGSSLAAISIECRSCGGNETMRTIFTRDWMCSGRFAESGQFGTGSCSKRAQILLKGAANLRVPEVVGALTIPPNDTPLHHILGRSHFQTALLASPVTSKADLLGLVSRVPGLVREDQLSLLKSVSEQEMLTAIQDLKNQSKPLTPHEMKVDEFRKLVTAATHGAPQVLAKHHSMPPWFEVVKHDVKTFVRPKGTTVRVAPLNRLRVVMVQKGYTRPIGGQQPVVPPLVECPYFDGVRTWYPGVELSGEGIFLDLPEGGPRLDGPHATAWMAQYTKTQDPTHHPAFVWWHTYAHRVLTALSVDSGYAAASIRERIFVSIDEAGQAKGGCLLYTSQPGGDGTLGGLVALVPAFNEILEAAEAYADSCSNDPICEEAVYTPGAVNGAACYACQLISETSCDHRNRVLDRNLLKDNMP